MRWRNRRGKLVAAFHRVQSCYNLMRLRIHKKLMSPNDPKLSHGANNCKRGFAANLQMKEQPPLAPARC
jgi:hypothetical protein